jgi:DNA-binding LacI/PurR family transcriptional regulator
MANPSMRQIAAKAGVSTATVSMAMRGHPQISEGRRAQILKIARSMGYRPNPMVSSLMTQIRTGKKASKGSTLAILGPAGSKKSLTDSNAQFKYPNKLYQSILKRSEELGYQVDIFSADSPDSSLEQLMRVIEYRNIQGVLLAPFPTDQQEIEVNFSRERTSVVAIGYSQLIENVNRVAHDQFKIAYETTQTCIARGYRKIGLQLQSKFNARTGHHYPSAFLGAHYEAGKTVSHQQIFLDDVFKYEAIAEWIQKEEIDCLIAQNPHLYRYLIDAGWAIPETFGFAGISWSENIPEISGMYHSPEELGHVVVDLVTAHIQRNESGLPGIAKTMMIAPIWHEGNSLKTV